MFFRQMDLVDKLSEFTKNMSFLSLGYRIYWNCWKEKQKEKQQS